MLFYTGLTKDQVEVLWKWLSPAASKLSYVHRMGKDDKSPTKRHIQLRKLSLKTELLLTLMRLRAGLLHQDLAYRFGIHVSTVSRIVRTWIQFLYVEFSELKLLMFPGRHIIKDNLPSCFKSYKNIRCIVDCTEIFVQESKDFRQQVNLYSSYKSHNTYKILVGIAPNGAITYISDCLERSISDVEIVKRSGFLDLLESGDMVMADRGFTIRDILYGKKLTSTFHFFWGTETDCNQRKKFA